MSHFDDDIESDDTKLHGLYVGSVADRPVGDALRRFDQVERMDNSEDIKHLMPWVRCAVDMESGRSVLFVNGTNGRTPIAEVLQSGVGNRDDRGESRAMASNKALGAAGVGLPPFHGNCRTSTLAI